MYTKGNTGKTRSLIRQEKRKRGEDGKDIKDNVAQFHMKKKRGQGGGYSESKKKN